MRGFPDRLRTSLRETPALRLVVVVALALRIMAAYRLLALRHRLRLRSDDHDAAMRALHERHAQRVLVTVLRLQGLMIKIGQTVGSNPVAIPMEYVLVLARLQDAVPSRPWRTMRPLIERSLGRPIGAVFAEFDTRPVAAASLAQVYRARLHDGRTVAVKALYPGIERLVRADLRVLRFLLWLDSRFGGYPLGPIYDELARNVPLEVDLVHEARAMAAFAAAFHDDPRIVIPAVVAEHSSRRLLVMEWIDGIKVTDTPRLCAAGIDVQRVSDLISDCYARQMLVHGLFHADPHPGNLFALPGDRLAILDFGLTKRLTPAFRRSLTKLLGSMAVADRRRMLEAFDELGFAVERREDPGLYVATGEFFRNVVSPETYQRGPATMQALNEQWARAARANPFVAIPGDMALVTRVFSLITGVGVGMGARPHVIETVLRYAGEA